MSLFNEQPEQQPEKSRKKTQNVFKTKYRSNDEALIDNRYGTGSRSASRTTAARRTKNERRAFTEAYERGEIKFEDTSHAFLLCHCYQYPDYHSFPHSPHTNEIAKFELEHYGRKK